MVAAGGGYRLGWSSVLAILPICQRPTESLPRARSSPGSRVHVPGTFTVRGCPTVTDGLDGELARLQDRGTGGMAPFATPPANPGYTVRHSCGPSEGPM
jgi:hypothetical protein